LYIKINQQSWHAKLFLFSTSVWSQFRYEDERLVWRNHHRTNLCFYLRVILVWLPLVALAHAAFLMLAFFALIRLPIRLYGLTLYIKAVGTIAAVVLCLYLLYMVTAAKAESAKLARAQDSDTDCAPQKDRTPSFASLLKMRVRAAKDKICPIIVIQEEQS
jgi:hypothetical protein